MSFILNIVDYAILIMFFRNLLGERRKFSRLFFLMYSLAAVLAITWVNGIGDPALNFLSLIIYVFGTSLFFGGRWSNKYITVLLYLGFGLIAEIIVMWMMEYCGMKFGKTVPVGIATVLCEVIRYLFVATLCAFKKEKQEQLPKGACGVMSSILIVSLVGCLIIDLKTIQTERNLVGTLIIMAVFMIIHFLMFTLFEKFHHVMRINHEKEMILQETALKESYYKEVDDKNIKLGKLKHDLKNRLTPLCNLEGMDLREAEKVIREICQEITVVDKSIYCRNRALNSILKLKAEKAKQKNIVIKYTVKIPDMISMEYGDMGILYGNLLDNAIEACEKVDQVERKITLYTELKGKSLVVSLLNTKNPLEDFCGKTTKKDEKNHGFGLKSVRSIVDKHEGVMELKDEGELFYVEIMLYGIECLQEE